MLSSAGIIDAQKKFNSPYYYLKHQLIYGLLPGALLFFILSRINYKIWKKFSPFILFGSLFLLTLVFVPSLGQGLKGATRWVEVWHVRFQPAEFLKLAIVVYLAAWFSGRDERIKNWAYGSAPFFVVLSFVGILLALQPDIGTLIVVTLISLGVYFIAGVDLKHFVVIVLLLVVALATLIFSSHYRLDRIKTFMNPALDPRGISYQLNQSLISIGSGGLFGVGFGHSTQKYGFLPEVVSDSIFAIIAEELGLMGAIFTILLFLCLCFIMVKIAKNCRDKFGSLLVIGVNIWIMSQAFINIAAISGVAPLTGIPLPFISYGGTALVSLMGGLGLVYNVARD